MISLFIRGGDVSRIRMSYAGADKLSLRKGQLNVSTSVGVVTEQAPYSYLYNEQGEDGYPFPLYGKKRQYGKF